MPTPLARTLRRRREAARQELGCGHLGPRTAEHSGEFREQPVSHRRGPPRAAHPDPVCPADTQCHQGQKTSAATTLPPESKPAGTMLRKKQ